MTIQELYQEMGGSYEMAVRVLRMDKLIDKHIRKFANSEVLTGLIAQAESMDPDGLFESAHAAKGVCANLGLDSLSALAGRISDEFRPGTQRQMSDDEVKEILAQIKESYEKTVQKIRQYAGE